MKRLLLLCCFVALLIIPAAFASQSSATLTASPTNPVLKQPISFSGCGYPAGSYLTVYINPPQQATVWFVQLADSAGCFDSATGNLGNTVFYYTPQIAGRYVLDAFDTSQHHSDARLSFVAASS